MRGVWLGLNPPRHACNLSIIGLDGLSPPFWLGPGFGDWDGDFGAGEGDLGGVVIILGEFIYFLSRRLSKGWYLKKWGISQSIEGYYIISDIYDWSL
jgi:hypothetical protein